MRELFPGYYRLSEREIGALWTDALIVLDANVLLNLYRYPEAARNDLLEVLGKATDRLAVPYQAALEYQINRLRVVADQRRRFEEVRKVLSDVEQKLNNEFAKLQLQKRHSVIKPDDLIREISTSFDRFRDELREHETGQLDVFHEDSIRARLDGMLEGKIGPAPTQVELDQIYTDGKRRYEDGVPPGYEDAEKSKSDTPRYWSNGLKIERKFGDLIVWKQTIAIAKAAQTKKLIFVTDDEKPDWWWIVDSLGKKTVGPRPELVDEIYREAGVTGFYIYNSEGFILAASKHLGVSVDKASAVQIGEVREELRDSSREKFSKTAENAVYQWLTEDVFPDTLPELGNGFPDFFLDVNDRRGGYEVKVFSRRSFKELPRDYFRTHLSVSNLRDMFYVFVARDPDSLNDLKKLAEEQAPHLPRNAYIISGHLDFSGSGKKPKFIYGALEGKSDDEETPST